MPTYRYRCSRCDGEFEVWQSFQEDPVRTHDDGCGGAVLRVLTPAGIVLKGSGFYKTDSRSADRERSGSGATTSKSDTGSTSDPSEQGSSTSDSGKDTRSADAASTPSTTPTDSSKSTAGAAKPS
jgi:putative FmdB family regulatory protein